MRLTIAAILFVQTLLPNAIGLTTRPIAEKREAASETKNEQNPAPKPQPIISIDKCVGCFRESSPAHSQEQTNAYDASKDTLYKAYLWATIVGVVGGLIGLIVLICQTLLLRRNVNALRKIERPWVLISIKDGIEEIPGKTAAFLWQVTNNGKIPAIISGVAASFEAVTGARLSELQSHKIADYGQENTFISNSIIVAPDKTHHWAEEQLPEEWTEQLRRSVQNGERLLVARGIVRYRDVIDEEKAYESRFIAIYRFEGKGLTLGHFNHFADFGPYTMHT